MIGKGNNVALDMDFGIKNKQTNKRINQMEQEQLSKRHQEVYTWLTELFDGREIPNFAVNKATVSHLHKLMCHNKEMDRIGELCVDDLNRRTEEYKLEAARVQDCLEAVGLPVYVLSNAGKSSLKNLTELACNLQIKDVNKSSYCLAMAELSDQLLKTEEEIREKQKNIEMLKRQFDQCNEKMENIKSFYENIEEHAHVDVPVLEKRKKDTAILKQKTNSYHNQIEEFKAEESHIENQKHLHHNTLLKLSEQLNELKKELQPQQIKFKSYKSLPPDINMAKVKIEEAKRQLMSLEQQLQTDIDALTL